MNSDEKLALLALAKGFRKVLRQAVAEARATSTFYYWQIKELDRLIKELTD